jgi:hypothetical protein
MRKSLPLLLSPLLLLSSCSAIDAKQRALFCLLFCVQVETEFKKKPAEEAGLKTKSTEDFSDPQKDQAPKADAKQ